MLEVTSSDTYRQGQESVVDARAASVLAREAAAVGQSARQRAVVERATALLVERDRIPWDEAAGRLRGIAVEHGESVVAAGARILGVRPPAAVPVARMLRRPSSPDGDDAARVVALMARPLGVMGVVLFLVAPDGALRLLGSTGIDPTDVRPWSTIPPDIDVPLTRAVTTGRPVIHGNLQEQYEAFPIMTGVRSPAEATASLPIDGPDGVVAVVGLVWESPQTFDAAALARLDAIARACAPGLRVAHDDGELDLETVGAVLAGLDDPWLLLHPRRGVGGAFDARVLVADPRIPAARALVGCALAEIWPDALRVRLGEALDAACRTTGQCSLVVPAPEAADLPFAAGPTPVDVVRLGAELVLTWRRA